MKIIQQAKSIDRLIKQMKRDKGTRRAKRGTDASEDEISNLIQMQREAVQSAMEQSTVKPVGAFKGIRAAEKIQEEYQVAKTGVRSRIGKFAKVLGAGEKEASTLQGLFGKKVPEEELAKLREKFKIKTPEQIKAEKEQETAEKKSAKESMKAEKQEKAQKRQEQFDRIENLAERIADMVESIQQTIQGVSNKLGTEKAKNVQFKGGKYFDESGKRLKKAEVEKGAGVKYSQKAKRFVDVKTGKFVSEKKARQKMNLMPKEKEKSKATAVKSAPSSVASAGETLAAGKETASMSAGSSPTSIASTPGGDASLSGTTAEFKGSGLERRGMASKVLSKEEEAPVDDTGKKIDKLSKKVDGVGKGIEDILDIFSLKKFYALIGGAIGAAIPLLKKAVAFIWDIGKKGVQWISDLATTVWDKIKEFLTGIKLEIPEIMRARTIDLPGLDPFTLGPIGGFTFEPFKFLGTSGPSEGPSATEVGDIEKAPAAPGAAPAGAPSTTAAPAGGGGGGGVSAPATGGGAPSTAPSGGGGGSVAAPAAAPAGGGGTAARAGSSMAGGTAGGPERRLGPAAARRGKVDPGAAKNAALAAAAKFGITGPHLAQFMGQLDHESGGFKSVEENLRYSAKRLMQVFPKYYKDPAVAEAEANQPQLIANRVYGGRMGNGPPESGDGYKYRGRGLIQLTGKDNYKRFGSMAGVDLVSNPDMASDLATAADIAAAFYKKNVIDKGVDGNDTKKVTKIINGGSHGLSHREQLFASYSQDPNSLKATGPAPEPAAMAGGAPPAAAEQDIKVGGSVSGGGEKPQVAAATPAAGGGGGVSAPAAAPAAPAAAPALAAAPATPAAPTATPVAQTPASGYAVAAETTAVSTARDQMVASAAPTVVPVPTGGGGAKAAPPQPSGSAVRASVRDSENSFVRALAKDFAHPSTFTTIGSV